jgi:uncharacterized protein with HEPN domain
LEAVGQIERYRARGREAFDTEELLQVWMIHHVQVIGEAARALSEDFRSRWSEIPWAQIIGMRHILVHDYFGIDLEEVWATVTRDVPALGQTLTGILEAEIE